MIEEPVEDISEISRPASRNKRWELWLGLLLIVGVVVFALVTWRRDEDLARRYVQAQAAVARKDWDAAHTVFAGLTDYRDANTQAIFAQRQIDTRNSSYAAGMEALAAANWISATEAFSTTYAIQPTYKDISTLFTNVKVSLVGSSMNGLIYRRITGDRPGLYLNSSLYNQPYLPGSDSVSKVYAHDATLGYIVYDVPAATTSSTNGSSGSSVTNTAQAPRKMQLAVLTGQSIRTQLLQAPTNTAVQALSKDGMWQQTDSRATTWPRTPMYLMYANTIYTDFQTGASVTVSLPGFSWAVLNFDTAHNRLLLGEYIGKDISTVPGTRFYLSNPDGSDPQQIFFVGGLVQMVNFSADGNFLLFLTNRDQSVNGTYYLNQLSMLDLRQQTPQARTLAAVMSTNAITSNSPVDGFFLLGQSTPQVMVFLANSGSASISAYDILQGRQTKLWQGVSLPDIYWLADNGKSLIFRHYQNNQPIYSILENLPASPSGPRDLPAPDTAAAPYSASLSGPYVIYESAADGTSAPEIHALIAAASPTTAKGQSSISLGSLDSGFAPLILPNALIVYRDPQTGVHLRTFTNSLDFTVYPDTDAVWEFGQDQ